MTMKRYELTTLKDVFDKVPADRVKVCLHELAIGMRQARAMADLIGAVATEAAGRDVELDMSWPDTVTWIDDGKGELDLAFELGDEVLDYKVQLTPEMT